MLTFKQVTKQFGDETFALQEASFHVETGELVFITGPSGSGKTTIMRLLTKEYTPTEGEIEFNQQALSSIPNSKIHQHRRNIGVIFQDYKLVNELTVWENIALALEILGKKDAEIEERVSDLLHLVNLADKAFLFPSQLSGGEAQRVSIARALATAPQLIFADEPTGNLDPETSRHIAHLLKKINELGTTILFSTHDVGILEIFKDYRRIELKDGRVVKGGSSIATIKPAKQGVVAEKERRTENEEQVGKVGKQKQIEIEKEKEEENKKESEREKEKDKDSEKESKKEKEKNIDATELSSKNEITAEASQENLDMPSPKKKKSFNPLGLFKKKTS